MSAETHVAPGAGINGVLLPSGPRTVFAAIIAKINEMSNDKTFILDNPSGGIDCPALSYPMPVYDGSGEQIGEVELASVVDHRIIAFGRFYRTPAALSAVTKLYNTITRLEIDITGGTRQHRRDLVSGQTYDVISDWSLMSVTVGTLPAWDLPPVQIEELTK